MVAIACAKHEPSDPIVRGSGQWCRSAGHGIREWAVCCENMFSTGGGEAGESVGGCECVGRRVFWGGE